ncbi:glycosyltransferase family 4 protein [Devosia albogilva]|uniref:Glycosyltransferase family 4 protein n=1 Tax=Devosia albogilva TaxID=429726 RepID=A0ABW5QMI5_9HYPH
MSLANLFKILGQQADFHVVTTDRDLGDSRPFSFLSSHEPPTVNGASVYYLGSHERSLERITQAIHDVAPNTIYLNSFFDTRFSARVLLARRLGHLPAARLLLAPRGEFSAGALNLKAGRKRAYISTLKAGGFLQGVEWHASTALEAAEIEGALGPSPGRLIHIAPDLGTMPDTSAFAEWRPRDAGKPLRVCFLSRISPMKNLAGAVRALARMKMPAIFTLYGPKEDAAYWAECQSAIRALPSHITFKDGGVLTRDQIYGTLAQHDVFFLPTLGENYGHVIPEALSVGLPVIISDRTPWRGLAAKGVGYDGPLDEGSFAAELDRLAAADATAMARMRASCREYARTILTDPAAIEANRKLFLS